MSVTQNNNSDNTFSEHNNPEKPNSNTMSLAEKLFEGALWNSRFIVLFAVVASLLTAMAMFYIATVDAWYLILHLVEYASPALDTAARNAMRAETVHSKNACSSARAAHT